MVRIRDIPDPRELPSARGRYIIDTYREKFRIRSWPRKAGPATNPYLQRIQQRFAEATRTMKYVDAKFVNQAINIARGKGLYPRDILGHAIMSGMADLIDEFGNVETHWEPVLEEAVFQGCRVGRTSNLNVLAATLTPIPWQAPIIQTVPIFDLATPNRLTVPSNVNLVRLQGGYRGNTAVTNTTQLVIRKAAGTFWAETTNDNDATPAQQVDTGPIWVTAGDWFDMAFFGTSAQTIAAVDRTFFSMEILGTT